MFPNLSIDSCLRGGYGESYRALLSIPSPFTVNVSHRIQESSRFEIKVLGFFSVGTRCRVGPRQPTKSILLHLNNNYNFERINHNRPAETIADSLFALFETNNRRA